MQLFASIDIGTQSALLLIAHHENGRFEPIVQKIATPRIGRNLKVTGIISEDSIASLMQALQDFQKTIVEHHAELVAIAGTQAFRQAKNGKALALNIEELLHFPCRILTGEHESQIAFLAVQNAYARLDANAERLGMLDIGGGSSELQCQNQSVSIPLGAVSLFEQAGKDLGLLQKQAQDTVAAAIPNMPIPTRLIAVGGTVTALVMLIEAMPVFDRDKIEGFVISLEQLQNQIQKLASLSLEEIKMLPGIESSRVDIILPGLCLVEAFLISLQLSQCTISDRGLRYGLLEEAHYAA